MSPSRTRSLPPARTAGRLRRRRFWSLTREQTLSSPASPISALLRRLSQTRSYCDMFREEPAISDLDWTFTPRRGSRERFAYQHLKRSSTQLSPRFDLPTPRSPGFGSHTDDCTHLYTSRLFSCALVAFATASSVKELASPPICTPWFVLQNAC